MKPNKINPKIITLTGIYRIQVDILSQVKIDSHTDATEILLRIEMLRNVSEN